MKKRSLFAAVAMLIVSAMVLTSATYAWFASSQTVNVQDFSSTTAAGSGGLVVSATGTGDWKTTLKYPDYNITGNVLVGTWNASAAEGSEYTAGDNALVPVTASIGADSIAFRSGSLTGTSFRLNGNATEGYIKYTTYVKSPNLGGNGINIVITPNFSTTASYVYIGGFAKEGSTVKDSFVKAGTGSTGATYNTLTASSYPQTLTDDNANGIIDDGEKETCTLTPQGNTGFDVYSNGTDKLTITNITANTVYNVTFYVWAEGQDADCVSGSGTQTTSIDLAFDLVNTNTP